MTPAYLTLARDDGIVLGPDVYLARQCKTNVRERYISPDEVKPNLGLQKCIVMYRYTTRVDSALILKYNKTEREHLCKIANDVQQKDRYLFRATID